jgi:hypothetical protein
MTLERLVVLALAVWRVSYMLSHEEGPFDLFGRLRRTLGAREVLTGAWKAETVAGRLILCPLCLSVWLAFFGYLLVDLAPWGWPIVVVLAASGLASALHLFLFRH